ncbi:MAG: hypothetical protein HZA62_03720 [Rhodocyclales bacterium]|nr:hypothetical protein [Rhodocyclales bacterium]
MGRIDPITEVARYTEEVLAGAGRNLDAAGRALLEATPVHEAVRLQGDLKRAGISTYAWAINQDLFASATQDALLRQRGQFECPSSAASPTNWRRAPASSPGWPRRRMARGCAGWLRKRLPPSCQRRLSTIHMTQEEA